MASCPKCGATIEDLKFFGSVDVDGIAYMEDGQIDEEYEMPDSDSVAGFTCPKCNAIVAKNEAEAAIILHEEEDEQDEQDDDEEGEPEPE
jgi:transcription initiation factor IIE alpha subunit